MHNIWFGLILGISIAAIFVTSAISGENKKNAPGSSISNLDHYVSFVQPSLMKVADKIEGQKTWTKNEEKVMQGLLNDLLAKFPGIFSLATSSHRLKFIRTTQESIVRSHIGSGPIGNAVVARTDLDKIYITDSFLNGEDQYWRLLHELIHAADSGGRIAYSREFVSFVGDISQVRNAKLTKAQAAYLMKVCPNIDAITNLREALAYDIVAFVQNGEPLVPTIVIARLLKPQSTDLNWQRHFVRGISLYDKCSFGEAILEFRAAEAVDKYSPMCHYYMGRCFQAIDVAEQSSAEFQKAIEILDSVGVASAEPDRVRAEYNNAYEQVRLQHYQEAKGQFEKVIPFLVEKEQLRIAQQELNFCREMLAKQAGVQSK